jgi:hypothetical protein
MALRQLPANLRAANGGLLMFVEDPEYILEVEEKIAAVN